MEFISLFQILVKGLLTLYILYLTVRFVFTKEEVPVNENSYQLNTTDPNTKLRLNREVNLNLQNQSSPVSKLFDSLLIIALDVIIFNYIWISSSI